MKNATFSEDFIQSINSKNDLSLCDFSTFSIDLFFKTNISSFPVTDGSDSVEDPNNNEGPVFLYGVDSQKFLIE